MVILFSFLLASIWRRLPCLSLFAVFYLPSATLRCNTRQTLNVSPIFKSIWSEERKVLEYLGVELYIPLISKEDLVGFLTVGPKLSGASYSGDDRLTLTTLANQTAVAVENARLYEELEDTFEVVTLKVALTPPIVSTVSV